MTEEVLFHGRPKGYRPDHYDPRDLTTTHMMSRAPVALLPKPDQRKFRGARLEQGMAGSCVSFAKTRTINISHRLQGDMAAPCISPWFDYVNARRQEHTNLAPERQPPLQDVGSLPRLSMEASRKLGIVPWDVAPYPTPDKPATDAAGHPVRLYNTTEMARFINTQPNLSAYQSAYDQMGLLYYRIQENRQARIQAIIKALKAGFAVLFGMSVDKAYEDHTGSDPVSNIDPDNIAGGHMQAILQVEDSEDVALVENWWGPFWGFDDGFCRMTTELLGSPYVSDVIAVQAVPTFGGAS